jgi:hypothetical protein
MLKTLVPASRESLATSQAVSEALTAIGPPAAAVPDDEDADRGESEKTGAQWFSYDCGAGAGAGVVAGAGAALLPAAASPDGVEGPG